jgi:hypothetical protein
MRPSTCPVMRSRTAIKPSMMARLQRPPEIAIRPSYFAAALHFVTECQTLCYWGYSGSPPSPMDLQATRAVSMRNGIDCQSIRWGSSFLQLYSSSLILTDLVPVSSLMTNNQ